ncbi:MAG: hypothetical protein ACRYGK_00580, partial [Janthinobacterium lividum]
FVGCPDSRTSVHVGDKFTLKYEVPRTLDDVLDERPMAAPSTAIKNDLEGWQFVSAFNTEWGSVICSSKKDVFNKSRT